HPGPDGQFPAIQASFIAAIPVRDVQTPHAVRAGAVERSEACRFRAWRHAWDRRLVRAAHNRSVEGQPISRGIIKGERHIGDGIAPSDVVHQNDGRLSTWSHKDYIEIFRVLVTEPTEGHVDIEDGASSQALNLDR